MNLVDRKKRQAEITHLFEQAVQRGLVGQRAGEQRIAVVFQRDAQAIKPVAPLTTQMALEPDLIDHGRNWICLGGALVRHRRVPGVAGRYRPCHVLNAQALYPRQRVADRHVGVGRSVVLLGGAVKGTYNNKPSSRARATASVRRCTWSLS